ncbi:hypothetical protein BCR39DRAFT_466339 [Naematelia encephala]|uniref:Uncharacterized protein n=1 Tax=Naematelia encephala TaxID=71784 RepID=A0A1Y2B7K1_9TREE|nr:hypothetical protein BCR39DRAFT_466339 [Naematelia encephala]
MFLTQESLAQLSLSTPPRPHRWHAYVSATPSATSVSDGEEGEGEGDVGMGIGKNSILLDEEVQAWADAGRVRTREKGKGKGKEKEKDRIGLWEGLPQEILIQVLRHLGDTRDLLSALLVSRTWCLCAFPILWYKPPLTNAYQLAYLSRIISQPHPSLPYANAIRRLNLAAFSSALSDDLVEPLARCTRVERLTLTAANGVSAEVLKKVVKCMPELCVVDFSGVEHVDPVIEVLAEGSRRLQGFSVGGCMSVGDESVLKIAKYSKILRRAKLNDCHRLTDTSLAPLARSCIHLLEIDLSRVPQLSDATLYSIFVHDLHLRDLKLQNNTSITDDAFPRLAELYHMSVDELTHLAPYRPEYASYSLDTGVRRLYQPAAPLLDLLRVVDFTGCTGLRDGAVETLIANTPKLRNLTLAKCSELTDAAVESIGRLGKHLHYLHLGHVSKITDVAVTKLARACTRLRYVDLACCQNLTDLSVFELAANLPKLKRIGLVKVINLTDEGIYALVERHSSLERIHLSYCDKVSVKAVAFLLNRVLRLTHLSLTGIPVFKTSEFQQFCRPAPADFNEHQQSAFCVFSGHGVHALRHYLNAIQVNDIARSDDGSTRRGSDSSTSSITVPGGSSPRVVSNPFHVPGTFISSRRSSAPVDNPSLGPGVPEMAFVRQSPNFLAPEGRSTNLNVNVFRPLGAAAGRSRDSSASSIDTRERPGGPRGPHSYAPTTGPSSRGLSTRRSMDVGGSRSPGRMDGESVPMSSSGSRLRWVADMVGWSSGASSGDDTQRR